MTPAASALAKPAALLLRPFGTKKKGKPPSPAARTMSTDAPSTVQTSAGASPSTWCGKAPMARGAV